MALLYERSALWRAIVSATRDPRILVLFAVSTTAGGIAIGKGLEMTTAGASERVKDELEKKLRKDVEAARYASHSKNALAVLLDTFKPADENVADDPNAKYRKNPIKLPGVMWHPHVAQKEKEASMESDMAVSKEKKVVAAPVTGVSATERSKEPRDGNT